MTNCYPVWTAAPRAAIHHIARRITHHTLRHAALATVRIVCVAAPAWLATPSPASAPAVPGGLLEYPPMLPWPEGDEAPWGWGGEMPTLGVPTPEDDQSSRRLSTMRTMSPEHRTEPVTTGGGETFTSRTVPVSSVVVPPGQAVPEPGGLVVLGVGLVVLGIFKGVKR